MDTLRLGTRGSELALFQANAVAALLATTVGAAAQTAIDIVLMHSLYRLLAVASFLEIASAAFSLFQDATGR